MSTEHLKNSLEHQTQRSQVQRFILSFQGRIPSTHLPTYPLGGGGRKVPRGVEKKGGWPTKHGHPPQKKTLPLIEKQGHICAHVLCEDTSKICFMPGTSRQDIPKESLQNITVSRNRIVTQLNRENIWGDTYSLPENWYPKYFWRSAPLHEEDAEVVQHHIQEYKRTQESHNFILLIFQSQTRWHERLVQSGRCVQIRTSSICTHWFCCCVGFKES